LRSFVILAAFAATLLTATPAAAAITDEQRTPQSAQSDLIALINAYRAANGLQTVGSNGSLASAATWMANDMATNNYFSHTSSDGRTPVQRIASTGYPAYSVWTGENMAAGYSDAASVIAGWKASPAHNAVLMNANYSAVGIGLVYNANSTYKWYWVADFGGTGGAAAAAPAPVPTVRAQSASRGQPPTTQADTAAQPDPAAQDPAAIAEAERVARSEARELARFERLLRVLHQVAGI
jgi:uncharacterized protein YkwD